MEPQNLRLVKKFAAQPEKMIDGSGILLASAFLTVLFGTALLAVEGLDYKSSQAMPSASFRQAFIPINDRAH